MSRKRPAHANGAQREPVTLRAVRLSGRYQVAATVIGVVLTGALGYGVFLAEHHTGSADAQASTRSWKQPVKIEQVTSLDTAPDNSFVVPGNLQLRASQLATLNRKEISSPNYLTGFETANKSVPLVSGATSVTVMGNAPTTVTITGMQVIKQCRSPLAGTFFYNPAAGENSTISLGFNLDSLVTYAQDTKAGNSYNGDFFQQHVVTLAPGETHTFVIYVTTTHHYCHFSFQMAVATPHGTVNEEILHGGMAFQLTAMAGTYNPKTATMNLSPYRAVYVGGVANAQNDDKWTEVNPKTYNGLGNPASFPPK